MWLGSGLWIVALVVFFIGTGLFFDGHWLLGSVELVGGTLLILKARDNIRKGL